MFTNSKTFRDRTDFPDDLFPKRVYFGKAVAEIWLGRHTDAIQSLNSIGKNILNMQDLFDADDIKERDVDKFLISSSVDQLNVNVKEYLKKVKSEKEKKKQA